MTRMCITYCLQLHLQYDGPYLYGGSLPFSGPDQYSYAVYCSDLYSGWGICSGGCWASLRSVQVLYKWSHIKNKNLRTLWCSVCWKCFRRVQTEPHGRASFIQVGSNLWSPFHHSFYITRHPPKLLLRYSSKGALKKNILYEDVILRCVERWVRQNILSPHIWFSSK